jgi:hypothetical protein
LNKHSCTLAVDTHMIVRYSKKQETKLPINLRKKEAFALHTPRSRLFLNTVLVRKVTPPQLLTTDLTDEKSVLVITKLVVKYFIVG